MFLKLKWQFRFHLVSIVVLMLAIGFCLWLNLKDYDRNIHVTSADWEIGKPLGWPKVLYVKESHYLLPGVYKRDAPPFETRHERIDMDVIVNWMLPNMFASFAIVLPPFVITEWFIRRCRVPYKNDGTSPNGR